MYRVYTVKYHDTKWYNLAFPFKISTYITKNQN